MPKRADRAPSKPYAGSHSAAASTLAEDYEELCELLVRSRKEADAKLSETYGEEIRSWVED